MDETRHDETGESSQKLNPAFIAALVDFVGGSPSDFDDVTTELATQTPRGVAVLGASFLESRLRESLKQRMFVRDDVTESLFGSDDSTGRFGLTELGQLAYCLGLIGPQALADARTIGTIRNRFAHRKTVSTFSDHRIKELCNNLKSPELFDAHVGRESPFIGVPEPHHDPKEADESLCKYLKKRFLITIFSLYIIPFASVHEQRVEWKDRANKKPIFW